MSFRFGGINLKPRAERIVADWRNAADFASIQAAVDDLNGAGKIYVPAGTFNEVVVVDEVDVILQGVGWASIINGGTTDHAIYVDAARCEVRDLQAITTPGGGEFHNPLHFTSNADDCLAFRVFANGSDNHGIESDGDRLMLALCYILNADNRGIYCKGNHCHLGPIGIFNCGGYGIRLRYGDDNEVNGFIIDTTGDDGILNDSGSDNNIIDGGRIKNWTNEAIDENSGTTTLGDVDTT